MIAPGFQLPPGFPEVPISVPQAASGESDTRPSYSVGSFTREAAGALLNALEQSGDRLAIRPVADITSVLGRVGLRFMDPLDPLRREAEARIPDEAGLSGPMAREVVQGMARDWSPERLRMLLDADFPDPTVLDGFRPGTSGDFVRAVGGRLALHVGSGNVPGVGATSVIRSLLVKCPVLLKPGRGDVALPCLFARGLAEEDEGLASALAVVYWPGGTGEALEELAIARADRVVAYGGPALIADLRNRLPPTTPLTAYHHRMSIGAVAREILESDERAMEVATAAARAVALFDQRGCVSAQVIWVESGGRIAPERWAELLAKCLATLHAELPPGAVDPATSAEVTHLKVAAELRRAAGGRDRVLQGDGAAWSVLFEPDPAFPPPCQGRTVRVKPIERLESLGNILESRHHILQTLALAGPDARRMDLSEGLAGSGVTRITTFQRQPWPPSWWRHDGQGPLAALVNWVGLEAE